MMKTPKGNATPQKENEVAKEGNTGFSSPNSKRIHEMQQHANTSGQVQQLKSLQAAASASPQVQELSALERGVNQRKVTEGASQAAIQRKVKWPQVDMHLMEGIPHEVNDPHDRDQMETQMVIDALTPYVNSGLDLDKAMSALKKKIQGEERLNAQKVAAYVNQVIEEMGGTLQGSEIPDPEKFPMGSVDRMTADAESKLGFYEWTQPEDSVFVSWVKAPTDEISSEAKLNCWQAILVSAVSSGVLDKKKICDLLEAGKSEEELFSAGAKPINMDQGENAIQKGDIITFNTEVEDNWHVVLAVGNNTSDWKQIPIMSHYRTGDFMKDRSSSLFSKTTMESIEAIAPGLTSITHKSLLG